MRIAMMAITTSSSMRVKPLRFDFCTLRRNRCTSLKLDNERRDAPSFEDSRDDMAKASDK